VSGSITLGVLALVRPTWIVVMPLWGLVITRHSGQRRIIAAIGASLVAGVVMLMIFNRTVAPYSRGFSFVDVLNQTPGSPAILENLLFDLRRTVTLSEYDALEILHRAQYWGFLVAALALALGLWWRRADPPSPSGFGEAGWRGGALAHLTIAATTMLAMLGLMLVLYSMTNWGEHRCCRPSSCSACC
jgi:hypothetical protein